MIEGHDPRPPRRLSYTDAPHGPIHRYLDRLKRACERALIGDGEDGSEARGLFGKAGSPGYRGMLAEYGLEDFSENMSICIVDYYDNKRKTPKQLRSEAWHRENPEPKPTKSHRPLGSGKNDEGINPVTEGTRYAELSSELENKSAAAREIAADWGWDVSTKKKLQKVVEKLDRWAAGRLPPRDT